MGDPAGISPELTAKVVALDEVRKAARIIVIGDRRVFDEGARIAGTRISDLEFQDLKHLDPATIKRGVASEAGGASALANYRHALRMVADGKASAVCFTPFNKQAMRLADASYDDQGQIRMKLLGFDRGVTLLGGYPFPICTPAHGTAYDIAGKGIANVGAARAALLLAARMAQRRP